jgi:pimeloyl-ACP methyl ester carboxylesterase
MDAAVFREPRRRVVAVPGGEIAALEFGPEDRAIDIVFVHANGFNAQTYRTLLSPLAAGLRILAIDQRGHGATTLPA